MYLVYLVHKVKLLSAHFSFKLCKREENEIVIPIYWSGQNVDK